MDWLLPLATVAIVQLMAVISPGQSFLVISKLALSSGRPAALAATLGMGVGSVIWASAAILGLAVVLTRAAWLYSLLKIAGGLYLLYLAVMLWRHAADAIAVEPGNGKAMPLAPAFTTGLLTQLANPKVAVFFGSIFFALLPAEAPAWVYGTSVAIVFLNETGWYALVSLVFSSDRPRKAYFAAKAWIDRAMSAALGLIGARLMADGVWR